MSRNHLSAEESMQRIRSQITNEVRLQHADVALENNGSEEELAAIVRREWTSLIDRFGLSQPDAKVVLEP
jgi:dephospho-CoA kinase